MFYRNYTVSANTYSPSLYSTTIAWNSGSAYIDHVIEHDASRFFQDDEFAVMSIGDPGDAESFLPTLDINISMALLSPTSNRLFREGSGRPNTAGSSRPRTGNPARHEASRDPQTEPTTSPRTGGSRRPQTASTTRPATAGKARPFSAGP